MYGQVGYLDVGAEFRTHAEACNLFGHSYKHFQRAVARHPAEPDCVIWFPRFYENTDWETKPVDRETISERRKVRNDVYVEECLQRPELFSRLVFAAIKPGFYRFQGKFEIDPKESKRASAIIYRRKASRVKTYARR